MGKEVMVCGVDCHPGDENCNNYCNHDKNKPMADSPADAPPEMMTARARHRAHRALDEAERTWHDYAAKCDVGPERKQAFCVFERLRVSRRTEPTAFDTLPDDYET